MKKFLEWIKLKEWLDYGKPRVPHVSEGQIWWANIGENIGREINGNGKTFARPVLIYKYIRNFPMITIL